MTFKKCLLDVFSPALQVYLMYMERFRMPFLTYLTKTLFIVNPFLEMIGKDDKINCYISKSKTAFKTSFRTISKLAEHVKIHLNCNFKKHCVKEKKYFI